jgi:hypothetical protein
MRIREAQNIRNLQIRMRIRNTPSKWYESATLVYMPPRLQSKHWIKWTSKKNSKNNFKHNIFLIKITNVINDHLGITRLTTRVGGKYQILECFLIIKIEQNFYYLPKLLKTYFLISISTNSAYLQSISGISRICSHEKENTSNSYFFLLQ